ncbi:MULTISPECIES: hypothetical protein [Deinococcus]|uniref:DUF5666 domain-containing protein n=1 Tax=Deinococcus daejeonensis TaxID=1007098 RepID=A0ABQ2JFN6_9DEIO|nr:MULTISPECIES: hypothetical protein [Deinococcus]RIX96747.1 hypothetical protein D3W47_19780 [Deinococcus sp. RM]GGN46580.1 hypothetical protein GCM10010842_37250 [Deinococcus daejeonensis]
MPPSLTDCHPASAVFIRDGRTVASGTTVTIDPPAPLKPGDRLTLHVFEEQGGAFISSHAAGRSVLTLQ